MLLTLKPITPHVPRIMVCCNVDLYIVFIFVAPSALSVEEHKLLESLDRLNERLKGKLETVIYILTSPD